MRYPLTTNAVSMGRKVQLPDGPLIVIANHVSHADSAALVTVIWRARPVLVVATDDGWDDLAAAKDLVAAGVVLVIFAEGSRSVDGSLLLSFDQLMTALLPRITRIFVIGGGGWLLGGLLKKWLRPCLGLIQVTALSFFPLGLLLAVWFWV